MDEVPPYDTRVQPDERMQRLRSVLQGLHARRPRVRQVRRRRMPPRGVSAVKLLLEHKNNNIYLRNAQNKSAEDLAEQIQGPNHGAIMDALEERTKRDKNDPLAISLLGLYIKTVLCITGLIMLLCNTLYKNTITFIIKYEIIVFLHVGGYRT